MKVSDGPVFRFEKTDLRFGISRVMESGPRIREGFGGVGHRSLQSGLRDSRNEDLAFYESQ
ncbi:MAG: hypothetical protein C4530_14870 [Desulfobacteraceae bacterium]|nr:MAG: hypothetical protein C4530_14870 [Desulfobacteraceae bacterium]